MIGCPARSDAFSIPVFAPPYCTHPPPFRCQSVRPWRWQSTCDKFPWWSSATNYTGHCWGRASSGKCCCWSHAEPMAHAANAHGSCRNQHGHAANQHGHAANQHGHAAIQHGHAAIQCLSGSELPALLMTGALFISGRISQHTGICSHAGTKQGFQMVVSTACLH